MVIDLTDYKTASRLSPHINAGASARLNLQPLVTSLTGEAGQAFAHGWRTTDVAENKAGRPMPLGSRIGEVMDRMRRDLHDPDQAERLDALAGRVGGVINPPCSHCGGGPVYCRHCTDQATPLEREVSRLERTGHGHVVARLDGVKARCGGPSLCRVCQGEQAAIATMPTGHIGPTATSMVGG